MNDFKTLLNPQPGDQDFDESFLQYANEERRYMEKLHSDNENNELNQEITTEELKMAIENLKLKKASGIELIPNDKSLQMYLLLFFPVVFKKWKYPKCMETSIN